VSPPGLTQEEQRAVHDVLAAAHQVPYPPWLNTGDNTWQLVAATLVGLMSLPGLAVLYASIVQKKWSVNVLLMTFTGFSIVLIVWVLWAYKMGFGDSFGGGVATVNGAITSLHPNATGLTKFFENLVGKPGPIVSHFGEQNQAVSGANSVIPFHFPEASLAYFQFVFAAITPLLFLGSILGRLKFKAWCLLVPLWITFVYAFDAFLLWGGGYFAQEGAVDYSGGYVIHMSAGVSGFVAAWVLGPRLLRDREHALPNNLVMAAVGAGILWLGWNGFNGGDPYYAGVDAAAAVLNTNIATAAGVLTWVGMDAVLSKQKKPTFLGAVNGMICGLVGITPCAGWVDGYGAILVGVICSGVVWFAWTYLPNVRPFSKVDDALGVIYTHGIAGFLGGMLVGFLGDPGMTEYGCSGPRALYTATTKSCTPFSVGGLFYTGSWHQVWEQFRAAVWVILWSAVVTYLIMQLVKVVCRGLRYDPEVLEVGDVAIHDEEAFPEDRFAERVGGAFAMAGIAVGDPTPRGRAGSTSTDPPLRGPGEGTLPPTGTGYDGAR
jgi:Amt family ammonium transporter